MLPQDEQGAGVYWEVDTKDSDLHWAHDHYGSRVGHVEKMRGRGWFAVSETDEEGFITRKFANIKEAKAWVEGVADAVARITYREERANKEALTILKGVQS